MKSRWIVLVLAILALAALACSFSFSTQDPTPTTAAEAPATAAPAAPSESSTGGKPDDAPVEPDSAAPPVPPAGTPTQRLTLVNNSGTTVCYVYISPTTETTWGADWLSSSETVANGASRAFDVPSGSYDLRADDCSHNVLATQWATSITSATTWTVSATSAPAPVPPSGGTTSFTVYNSASTPIWYLYISPTTSSEWGSDWLGASTIPVGGSYTFTVPNGSYDLKAEDSSNNVIATQFGVSIPPTTSWNVTGGSAPAPSTTSFTVYNQSGGTVCYMYISPSTSSEWGSDWLGADTISAGSSYTFSVPNGSYDLKAEDCSHNVIATQFAVSIPPTTSWNVTGSSSGTTSFTVYNNSSTSIWYVYISPTTSSSWGSDWLGSSTIPSGGSYTFTVPNGSYDLKAEDSSHNVMATWMGVSIPPTTSWSVP